MPATGSRLVFVGAVVAILSALSACAVVPSASKGGGEEVAVVQPLPAKPQVVKPAPAAKAPAPKPTGPTTFVYSGELTQGGWIRGQAPAGTVSAKLGDQDLTLTDKGEFFAAFDRDAGTQELLVASLSDGRKVESPVAISPRKWNIEHINVARHAGGPSEAFMKRRRPELAQIHAARAVFADSDGWSQNFIWPVKGRISGRFGSQRIYRGEPGSYHTGLDIATGESGTPIVAPADGVVVLAANKPFSLEGNLLMIDHGMGLNSAFLHLSEIDVKNGQKVRQGEMIGRIGSSGRATGPHLHWSIKWRDARLDPLLFLPPM
ncbi:peptidoglycan DD-metalloendopeptidase family protein [Altererythrobacter indicus]|uniref:Peptidoglycan DD-metalloendopeptidase family protein n=1 Tax=Altericroceibacterium indicum TaxID=374177 RepID=A0A845AA89_9SPHN|nr:peptidoglycan DD-metalloendopeptidase family protein [Altericroceibacterium indicum]